ncbi:MAG TPA: PTS sugar transporter subunit IIA [Candidatus Binataceae bacterium]|nr:PTS sugar transporter subunit IIA [Candidatus Binataceae bacterium]
MKITDFLTPEAVIPALKGQSKADVLNELAQCLSKRLSGLSASDLAAVLAERERLGSTAIGDGIAIPHGKLAGVADITGAFGRHGAGMDFESLDGNPTHLFFVLVAPEDSTSLHLKALARVSRIFRDGSFRQKLLSASEAGAIFDLIKKEDEKF